MSRLDGSEREKAEKDNRIAELEELADRLGKALDKACQVLENLDKRSLHYQEKYLRSIGCDDEVEFAMSKEEWKEWCLQND